MSTSSAVASAGRTTKRDKQVIMPDHTGFLPVVWCISQRIGPTAYDEAYFVKAKPDQCLLEAPYGMQATGNHLLTGCIYILGNLQCNFLYYNVCLADSFLFGLFLAEQMTLHLDRASRM